MNAQHFVTTATGMPRYCVDELNGFKSQLLLPNLQPDGSQQLYGAPRTLYIDGSEAAIASGCVLYEQNSEGFPEIMDDKTVPTVNISDVNHDDGDDDLSYFL